MPAAELMSLFFAIKKKIHKAQDKLAVVSHLLSFSIFIFTSSDLLTFIILKTWKPIPTETWL